VRRFTKILVGLALVFLALLLARNFIARKIVEKVFTGTTEFKLTMDSINVSLVRPLVEIKGLKLENPGDFPEPDALDVKTVYIHYNLFSLMGDEVRFKKIELDIPRVAMITKADGESNMDRIQAVAKKFETQEQDELSSDPKAEKKKEKDKPSKSSGDASERAEASGKPKNVVIDTFTFRLGEVKIRDYSRTHEGGEPRSMTVQLNVDRTFTDVRSLKSAGSKIAAEVATRTVAFYIKDVGRKLEENGDTEKIGNFFKGLGDMFKGKKKSE
jgi:uncharacterized protein involved in outer membrane biogenesis